MGFRNEIEGTRSKRQKMREKEQQEDKEKTERTRHQTRSTAQVSQEISDNEESPKPVEESKRQRSSSAPRSTARGGNAASTLRSSRRLNSSGQTDSFAFPDDVEEGRKGVTTEQASALQSRRRENKKSIITQRATPEVDADVTEVPAQKSVPMRSDLTLRNTNSKLKSRLLEADAGSKARNTAKVSADHDSDVEFVRSENANSAVGKNVPSIEGQDCEEVIEVDGPTMRSEAPRHMARLGRSVRITQGHGKGASGGSRRLSPQNDVSGRVQSSRPTPPSFQSTKMLRPPPQHLKSAGKSSGERQRDQLIRSNSEQNLRTDSSGTFIYNVRSSSVADGVRGKSKQLYARSQDMPGARKPAAVQPSGDSSRHNEPTDEASIPRRSHNPHFDLTDRERREQSGIQHSPRVRAMQSRPPGQEQEEMRKKDSRASLSKNQASRPNPSVRLARRSYVEEGFPSLESVKRTASHSANNANKAIDLDEDCVESMDNSRRKSTGYLFEPTSSFEFEQHKKEGVPPATKIRTRSADVRSASGDVPLARLRRNSDLPPSDRNFERGHVRNSNVPVPSVGDVFEVKSSIALEKQSREWENQKDNREALQEALTGFMTIKLGLVNLAFNGLTTNDLRELIPKLNAIRRIRRLEVNNNKIEHLPCELVSICEDVTTFNAAWNRLSEVPDWFCESFQNLRILNLSFNSLETLPEGLNQLKNLEVLQLNNNGIEHLPRGLGRLACLAILILSHNRLTALPPDLGEENEHLSVLDISHNPCFCAGLPKHFEVRTGWEDIFIEGTALYDLLRPRERRLEASKLVAFLAGKSQSELFSIRNDGTLGLQAAGFTGNARP